MKPIVTVIYGAPSVGKSTLACSAGPGAVMFDFDNGIHRVDADSRCHSVNKIKNFYDVDLAQIRNYDTVIVDTADALVQLAKKEVANKRPVNLRDWGVIRQMTENFISGIRDQEKHLIFIAHTKISEDPDSIAKISPKIEGSTKDLIIQMSDIMGYMSIKADKRIINFNPTEAQFGKDPLQYGKPIVIDKNDNNFMERLINKTVAHFEEEDKKYALREKEYDTFIKYCTEQINTIKTVEDVNNVYSELSKKNIANTQAAWKRQLKEKLKAFPGIHFDTAAQQFVEA